MKRRDLLRGGMVFSGWRMLSSLLVAAQQSAPVVSKPSPDVLPAGPNWRRAFKDETGGLDYYSQGGIVVDGTAYFTANDWSCRSGFRGGQTAGFPCAEAFRADDYKVIRRYPFAKTYDSSPLVTQKKDGGWIVLAHEFENARTVALARDTGEVQWISAANQPGPFFFGYSYYQSADGSKLILMACSNGLHALSSETGRDVWWIKREAGGGVTPCIDQAEGWIFYQCTGKVLKIRAEDGKVLKSVDVGHPNQLVSWNTVLVNDSYGYFVATSWYGNPTWDSAVRVFDKDLNLVWEKTGLPTGKKATLTYAGGKLITGSGTGWTGKSLIGNGNALTKSYVGHKWKYIPAYDVGGGHMIWKCDLSAYDYTQILNVPYHNGFFYAETQDTAPINSKLFRIRAADGLLSEVYNYNRPISSCATCIIACGKVFSGDFLEDRVVVTQIAENSKANWPGPFGDPQTNQMAVPEEAGVRCVAMREVGRPIDAAWESTGGLDCS